MTATINVQLNVTGIANGSDATTQQPTIVFQNLPFSLWATLPAARTVNGHVLGIAQPSQYQVMLFAMQAKQQYLGNATWVAQVGDDGTFQLPVAQAAMDYVALLMTPAFAQQYVASTFPGGAATVQALPLPVDHPGEVILLAAAPAGLDRSLLLGTNPDYPVIPALPPGQCWINVNGVTYANQVSPAPTNQNLYNPAQPTAQALQQLWFQYLLRGRGPFSFNIVLTTLRPDGTPGNGAFAAGVYAYGNDLYAFAAAGPLSQSSTSVAPVVTMSQLLDWQVFAPSMVQLNMAVTVLPARLMLALDVINVEPSIIAQFLKAMVTLEKDLLGLLLEEL